MKCFVLLLFTIIYSAHSSCILVKVQLDLVPDVDPANPAYRSLSAKKLCSQLFDICPDRFVETVKYFGKKLHLPYVIIDEETNYEKIGVCTYTEPAAAGRGGADDPYYSTGYK